MVLGPKAVVSDHARLNGQAYVAGNVRVGGYTRVRHTVYSDKEEAFEPNEVPLREGQVPGEDGPLWANYECNREEKVLLEDWFRYKSPGHPRTFYHVIHNGRLYGEPAFVVDGERRGFRFDGNTQYAEASPTLADLGTVTLHVALKWEGSGEGQTIFDFGTSMANRMILTPEGASGKAELLITREGKTERVIADAAWPRDTWVECRLEIDGKKIVLWLDGRKAAEQASSLRAADVYPPGVEKRNFLAAARDGSGKFKGVLDYLCVWHTVFDDFAKAPMPRRHAPRRISKEFVEWHDKEYSGAAEEKEAKIQERFKPQYAYYEEIGRRMGELQREIAGSPGGKEAHKQESDWLETFGWLGFSHHYNYPYRLYLRDKISKDIGGKVSQESGELGQVYGMQTGAKWNTRCDWEWRMKQELDGSVEKLPLLQKWIEKARGPVMAEKPAGEEAN